MTWVFVEGQGYGFSCCWRHFRKWANSKALKVFTGFYLST